MPEILDESVGFRYQKYIIIINIINQTIMNRFIYSFVAVFYLLAASSPADAQLIIRNNGHAEVGVNPFEPLPDSLSIYSTVVDTVTALKVFGNGPLASKARITFGDNLLFNNFNVVVGEYGNADTDQLWLHGKKGVYITFHSLANDTIMYFDPSQSNAVNFNKNVQTSGVFVQSDERFKENIEPVTDVLSSLEELEAVSYTLKSDAARHRQEVAALTGTTWKEQQDKQFFDQFYAAQEQGDERYGFLAQNVKDVFPQLVHTDKDGYMYVDYIGLIPILVQSINELRAELAAVKGEEQKDEEMTAPMIQAPQQAGANELETGLTAAKLYQNAPNPWSSETVIRYSLPQSVSQACIYIYDMQGKQLKSIPAQGRGESQVTITARDLDAGMYLYALVADGRLINSKQMVLTR